MACSACSKRKIVRQNSQLISMANQTFNDNDFKTVIYKGAAGQVIGVYTMINYGMRQFDDTMIVHKDDFNHESNSSNQIFSEVV